MLYFLDLETTGLATAEDFILEVACLAVDDQLVIQGEYHSVIRPMTFPGRDWCTRLRNNDYVRSMHERSGLVRDVHACTKSASDVWGELLEFINGWAPEKRTLAGSSIQFDRGFLAAQALIISDQFHYRMLDVSSIRIMVEQQFYYLPPFEAKETHRALDDVRESLERYKYYVDQLGQGL